MTIRLIKSQVDGSIRYNKVLLSAIFTTALNDQVTFIHPCKGVKTPAVPQKPRAIITPEQFGRLYRALPDDAMRLLVETKIETGLRWGELTELRMHDVDLSARMLTVSRAVVEVNSKFHPSGGRFLVKDYPKDREYRRLKLTSQIVSKLLSYARARGLGGDDLVFAMPQPAPVLTVLPNPDLLGRTAPNTAERTYRHGTLSAYTAGRCRCTHCKNAFAHYRAKRRLAGKDDPRVPRTADTDGHIPRNWFRKQIWQPALAEAGITATRPHDLRHAHASWLQMSRVASDASFRGSVNGRYLRCSVRVLSGAKGHSSWLFAGDLRCHHPCYIRCHDEAASAVASDAGMLHQEPRSRAATRTDCISARSSSWGIRRVGTLLSTS